MDSMIITERMTNSLHGISPGQQLQGTRVTQPPEEPSPTEEQGISKHAVRCSSIETPQLRLMSLQ